MYKIIGADQKEYGPISAEQLRQWIAEGRANPQTRVKLEGATSDWRPLSEVPEFADVLAAQRSRTPPSPSPAAPIEAKTSGLAITSLVMGILGCAGITALLGVILGIVALVKIDKSQGRLKGKGLAIAGICLSGLMMFMVIPAGLLLPALAKAKEKAQSINCLHTVKQLNLGVMLYASANSNQLPSAATWCDAILPDVGNNTKVFLCPSGDASKRAHYAFNSKLDGIDQTKITNPATTVMIFESDGGWNVSGGPEMMLTHSRHRGAVVVGFADGHVELVKPERLRQLRWDP